MMIKPYENNGGLETNLTKKWWKPKDLQGWSLSKTQEDPLQTTGWYIYIYIYLRIWMLNFYGKLVDRYTNLMDP